MKVFGVDVRQGAELQIPLEGVVPVELESDVDLARLHHGHVLEAVAQAEGAVVMEIVAQKLSAGDACGDTAFERRVRLEHGHHRQPAADS